MSTATESAAPKAGFALVTDVGDVARALRNLSGVGVGNLIGKFALPRTAERRIDLRLASGETIAVQVAGEGRPVLMIHGLGGSHREWDDAVESLSHRHTVHRFDLLGHGERAAAERRPSLQAMAPA